MLINKCTCVCNSPGIRQSKDDQRDPGMYSRAVLSRYLLGLSFPFCKMRTRSWPRWYPDSARSPGVDARIRRCRPGTVQQPASQRCPLPFPSFSPALLLAPAPAPPPACDGGRAAGRVESSEAQQTLPPDPIQALRGEQRVLGAQGPSTLRPAADFRRVGR